MSALHEWIEKGAISKEIAEKRGLIELVRCKDCKHNKSYQSGELFGCELGNGLHEPDWYCADGERREDDD